MENQACVMQSKVLVDALIVQKTSQQFRVDAILLRTKRGPSNKLARDQIREKVRKMYFEEEPTIAKRDIGSLTLYPSWTLHEVSELKKGERHSLVCWVTGKQFL